MVPKTFPPNKCRLCGINKSRGYNVYSTLAKETEILSRINKLLSKEIVHIVIGDELPTFVCLDCETVVNNFEQFCIMVQKVQKNLKQEKLSFYKNISKEETADLSFHIEETGVIDGETATVSIGPDGKVECMICQNYMDAVQHTTLHMVTHGIGTIICRCRTCGQQGELACFLQTDGDTSSIWCAACNFKSKPNWNQSNKNKHSSKSHTCETCSKKFRSSGHLARHKIVHSGAKPFLCEVCGVGFSQKSSLKLHVLSHSGINPHTCSHCGQTFRFKKSLHSHILNIHGSSMQDTKHECDHCGKRFATAYKLGRHYRSHTGEQPYECLQCGRLFSQSSNLNLHRKKHEEDGAAGAPLPQAESKGTPMQFPSTLLPQRNPPTATHFLVERGAVLPEAHDPKFIETILGQHPVVPCDLVPSLSPIESSASSGSEFAGRINPNFGDRILQSRFLVPPGKTLEEHKGPPRLFAHFDEDALLFIDQPPELPSGATTSEDGALPTFSSLQAVTCVSLPSLPH